MAAVQEVLVAEVVGYAEAKVLAGHGKLRPSGEVSVRGVGCLECYEDAILGACPLESGSRGRGGLLVGCDMVGVGGVGGGSGGGAIGCIGVGHDDDKLASRRRLGRSRRMRWLVVEME